MIGEIHNEDCLEGMKQIPTGTVDMILTDLPYGTTRNAWDAVIPFDQMWAAFERVIKPNGAIVLTAQTPFDKVLAASNMKLLRYEWIWVKNKPTGHLNAKRMPMKAHENVLVFYKNLPVYNAQGLERKAKVTVRKGKSGNGSNYGKSDKDALQEFEGYPDSMLYFDMDNDAFHPTQKPVALFEYLIKTYTREGETVLDCTIGSGTTAVAAINTDRAWIGFEMDPDMHKLASERIDQAKSIRSARRESEKAAASFFGFE